MKLYVLVVSAVLMVGGCDDSALKRNDKLDLPAICAKRSEVEARHEKFESMFLSCVNAPRRVATATDDEAGIVEECRIATSYAYGTSDNEDVFMSNTAIYATDCKTNGEPR
jgi:hypothetical protein